MEDSDYINECMTIVVPVYNRPSLIVRCLESLKSQTYRPLSVIVVDNGSTDDTLDKVRKWQHAHTSDDFKVVVMTESALGAAYSRELGLQNVKTDKVMFFDSDDVMRPNCVQAVMDRWTSNPDIDVIAWPVAIHQDGNVRVTHLAKGNLLERHLVHAILRTQGYAIKTEFLKKAGGWRGEYPSWNDLETGLRILLADPKVDSFTEIYADVYHQKESITGENFSSKHGNWEKSLEGIDLSISQSQRDGRQRLHNIVSYRRAILAAYYAREGHPELAKPLYEQAIREIPKKKRPLIRFAYHWTKCGLRGAFLIVGKFL